MKKDPLRAEKPKNAQNLKILRETLGLSQSQMALGLGGIAQGSYKMWEFETRTPAKVRAALFDAGVNLNWYDTGEGQMLRPGVERIQIIRDESNGKPIKLVPVMNGAQPEQRREAPNAAMPPREQLLREAQAIVDGSEPQLHTPEERADNVVLVNRVADLLEELHKQGKAHLVRLYLEKWRIEESGKANL